MKQSTIDFSKNLKEHNYREWFNANKSHYIEAKGDFEILASELLDYLKTISPDMEHIDIKQCVYRIYRDIRFSPDKTPYKTHFGVSYIKDGGRNSKYAGYYLQIGADESFFGGGIYMPIPAYLKAIRQEIYYQPEDIRKILDNPEFLQFYKGIEPYDVLKKAPKDYPKDFEEIELLKNKHFFASYNFNCSRAIHPDFCDLVKQGFKAVKPLVDFINCAVEI